MKEWYRASRPAHARMTTSNDVGPSHDDRVRLLDSLQGPYGTRSLDDDRRAFEFGWIIACAIVQTRYRAAAIDAVPVFGTEHGWDRFVLTRRLTCGEHLDDPPDVFGSILLRGDGAPSLLRQGDQVDLGTLLREDPKQALETALAWCPAPNLEPGEHSACWHERAKLYPTLYDAVTQLIIEHPNVVAAREIFVDDQHLGGTYHPLYLHGVATCPSIVYDWFSVEAADRLAFFRINGDQAIYQTDGGAWRAVGPVLQHGTRAESVKFLRSWLRLGKP